MARKDDLLKLKEVLLLRRDALRKALAGDLSMLKELRQQSKGDVVDFALDAAQDEISSKLAEVESRELANMENALDKMQEGTYGECEGCDVNIPIMRLRALPYATYCIECQQEIERTGEIPGSDDWSRMSDTAPVRRQRKLKDVEVDA